MKQIIYISIFTVFLTSCSWSTKYDPDFSARPKDMAVVVFYAEAIRSLIPPSGGYPIVVNDIDMGYVPYGGFVEKLMKPGKYKIHSDTFVIDRISNFEFKANEVYFIHVWLDAGMWTGSMRFMQTEKPNELYIETSKPLNERASYEVAGHKFEKPEYVYTQINLDTPIKKPDLKSHNNTQVLTTKPINSTPQPKLKKLNSQCIKRMKNTSDYSNSMKEIIESNQGSEYEQQINILNKKIEKACSEYDY